MLEPPPGVGSPTLGTPLPAILLARTMTFHGAPFVTAGIPLGQLVGFRNTLCMLLIVSNVPPGTDTFWANTFP